MVHLTCVLGRVDSAYARHLGLDVVLLEDVTLNLLEQPITLSVLNPNASDDDVDRVLSVTDDLR